MAWYMFMVCTLISREVTLHVVIMSSLEWTPIRMQQRAGRNSRVAQVKLFADIISQVQ